jgi:flavin reductase (DIM6/NTAB) family NADH-FMN oxidoreductase RutF
MGGWSGLMQPTVASLDVPAEAFCETLSRFPSGLTVVTALSAATGRAHGTTVSAFSSLSLDPPLILVALSRSSDLLPILDDSPRFGVNVLAAGQVQVGFVCGRKGPDKLDEIAWSEDDGLPRLHGAAAWVACHVHDVLPGGDHEIVIGRVTACDADELEPLVYHRRGFHRLVDASGCSW